LQLPRFCLLDHGRGDIDTDYLPRVAGEFTGNQSWTTSNIQNEIPFAHFCQFDQELNRIEMPRYFGKWYRLL